MGIGNRYLQKSVSNGLNHSRHEGQVLCLFNQWNAWKLGAKDLESMFLNYFQNKEDEFISKVEMTEVAVGYEMACKGLSEPVSFDDVSCGFDSYFSRYYADV